MYWLVKVNLTEFEVWTDAQHIMMLKKCEYYGAEPFWQEIRKLESYSKIHHPLEPGEIASYMDVDYIQLS